MKIICQYCDGTGCTISFGALGMVCNWCMGRGWVIIYPKKNK